MSMKGKTPPGSIIAGGIVSANLGMNAAQNQRSTDLMFGRYKDALSIINIMNISN